MAAQVLSPIPIASAMVTACSVAEPDTTTSEALWVAGTSYTVGQEVVRATTHRVYTNKLAGIDAGLPEATPLRWIDTRPSNKFAPFDIYKSTAIKSTSTLTMTVKPGIITGMAFYGLVGDTLRVVCRDATTAVVYYDVTTSLSVYLTGDLMWEFYYGVSRQQDSLRINNLTPTNAQVEITLTVSPTTGTAEIGIWALGSFADVGLPQYGFSAKPISYDRISTDQYGNTSIIKGLNARSLSGNCVFLSLAEAQAAADTIYQLLGVPCAWVISADPGYDYLSAFGLGSADIFASGPERAILNLTVRGLI